MRSPKSFISYLYYERRWRFYIRQASIYFRGLFVSYKHPETTFIVFAQGRTGSTILVDLINRSQNIHCDKEIFGGSMPIKVLFPNFYKRTLRSLQQKPIYGYRVKIYELTMFQGYSQAGAIREMRKEFTKGNKIIYLYRKNKFRQAMSSLVAESRGTFHQKLDKTKPSKVKVDHESLPYRINLLNQFTEWEKEAMAGFDRLEIEYETDLLIQENHQATLDKITQYLGSEPATANTDYKRSSKDDISEYVLNYDDVLETLEKSNNMHYLKG